MAALEHKYFTLTGQFAFGLGNQKGDKVDPADPAKALDFHGWSVFAELKLPMIKSTVIARYDWWNWDTDGGDAPTSRIIAGYAFHFMKYNFFLLSTDYLIHHEDGIDGVDQEWQVKLTLQVHYP